MRVDLQGEGTYTYECNDAECWYCEIMAREKLKQPAIIVKTERAPRRTREIFLTPDAEKFLKGNFDRMSKAALADKLNVCPNIIYKKAKELNLGTKRRIHDGKKSSGITNEFKGWY